MINQQIGSFIACLRKEQNLTQEQFAEKLGVSNRSVSRWENGKTLPDLSLMRSICKLSGITLPELLNGKRRDPSSESKESINWLLAVWEREKHATAKKLNFWFALGLFTLLAAILSLKYLSQTESILLIGLGIIFHGIGFYRNNQDIGFSEMEKAILTEANDAAAMRHPEELLTYARKSQSIAASQYFKAFSKICEELKEDEQISFTMVANEYSIENAPAIWHCGIAVTLERIFLCGETVVGCLMPRMVTDIYSKKDIISIRYTNHSILLKTEKGAISIKGDNIGQLGDRFKQAIT